MDAKNFKSYDELKKKLYEVLELDMKPVSVPSPKKTEDVFASASKRQSVESFDADEEDEDLKQFKALAG